MLWLLRHPQYKERPVPIKTFIYHKDYLGMPPNQIRTKIQKILETIFDPDQNYNEAIVCGGIGIGKSFFSSVSISYMVYQLGCLRNPQEYFNLAPGTKIQLMNMSTNQKQALEVVFGEIKARIDHSPWFNNRFSYDRDVESELRFPNQIKVIPGNSQESFFEGYNIFGGIIDEADAHKKTSEKDCAEDGYSAIQKRITSRFGNKGMLIVIGSPKSKHGFLLTKLHERESYKTTFTAVIPYWESPSPNMKYSGKVFYHRGIKIPLEHKRDFELNPEKFMRDVAAMPADAVEPFFAWGEKISENVNKDREAPVLSNSRWRRSFRSSDSKPVVVHIDLGINRNRGDACGFAAGHITRWDLQDGEWLPIIKIDIMQRIKASPGGEIQIADIRQRIYELIKRGFRVVKVTFDGWQSRESIQQLNKKKIKSEILSVDKDTAAYEALKETIYSERLDYYDYEPFITECERLELVDGKKVDHPPKGSKDVSDAVAGVIFNLLNDRKAQRMGETDFNFQLLSPRITKPVGDIRREYV